MQLFGSFVSHHFVLPHNVLCLPQGLFDYPISSCHVLEEAAIFFLWSGAIWVAWWGGKKGNQLDLNLLDPRPGGGNCREGTLPRKTTSIGQRVPEQVMPQLEGTGFPLPFSSCPQIRPAWTFHVFLSSACNSLNCCQSPLETTWSRLKPFFFLLFCKIQLRIDTLRGKLVLH